MQEVRPLAVEKLVLDMSGVKFLDSAGQRFALVALAQQGKAAMEVSGLLNVLPTYASVKEAVD